MSDRNPFFKVNKYEWLNQDRIEAVCAYTHSRPLVRYVKAMEDKDLLNKMQLKHSIKSIIFYDDGQIFLCPYSPETYMKKIDESCFTVPVPKKVYIRTQMILETTANMSAKQRREYVKAKEDFKYIRLSGKKQTCFYIFTENGRIYGLHTFRTLNSISASD